MKLRALEFGTYIFRIAVPSWLTLPLTRMECSSLSLPVSFSLKFILSNFRMMKPACFLVPLDWCASYCPLLYFNVVPIFKSKLHFL